LSLKLGRLARAGEVAMFSVIFINDLRYVEKVVVGRIGNIVDGRGVKSANVVGYARMWRAQRCTQGPVELGVVEAAFSF